jgi:hypothetical protein
MRKLWRDIKAHKLAVLLFFVYWLATLAVVPFAWDSGIPSWVMRLLYTVPLIAGFLVGWWRSSTRKGTAPSGNRISGGMLAGLLCAEITLFVMKGGVGNEVIGWIHGHKFNWSEVLEFSIAAGVFGVFLGLVGAVLAIILDRFRRHDIPTTST